MNRPILTVEIAFATNIAETPAWTDVSDYVIGVPSIRRGRANELSTIEAGTAEIVLDNTDSRFTPGNDMSPYAGQILPMRRVRIRAEWASVTYYLFTGYIERWAPTWPGGIDGRIALSCVDAFTIISQTRFSSYTFGSEDSHWRITGVLNDIGWPIADFVVTMNGDIAITAVALNNESPMPHLQAVAHAEGGQLYVDPQGRITFEGRQSRNAEALVATFGDGVDFTTGWVLGNATNSVIGMTTVPRAAGWVAGDLTELPYLAAEPSLDDSFIINEARYNRPTGVTWIAEDLASQARYGLRSVTEELQIQSELQVAQRADWTILEYAAPDVRFTRLVVSGHHSDALWPIILSLDISSKIAVIKRLPGAYALWRECWVEAIDMTIDDQTWQATYQLSPVRLLYA